MTLKPKEGQGAPSSIHSHPDLLRMQEQIFTKSFLKRFVSVCLSHLSLDVQYHPHIIEVIREKVLEGSISSTLYFPA